MGSSKGDVAMERSVKDLGGRDNCLLFRAEDGCSVRRGTWMEKMIEGNLYAKESTCDSQ
jgi:hypothetical protein